MTREQVERVCQDLIYHGRHFSPRRDAIVILKSVEYLMQKKPKKSRGLAMDHDTSKPYMVTIGGKRFRCECGCNVFHKPAHDRPMLYSCNGCGQYYEGAE